MDRSAIVNDSVGNHKKTKLSFRYTIWCLPGASRRPALEEHSLLHITCRRWIL